MNIKVVYNGPINEKLDKLISKMFEDNGFKQYAQGMDLMCLKSLLKKKVKKDRSGLRTQC